VSYAIFLSIEARHHLARLPAPVQRFCVRQLIILGDDPTLLSKPSRFPYREKCQIYRIGCSYQNDRWELCALFQYGQDEQTIFVIGIGFSKLSPDAESEDDFPKID
jgi:mRNA-degrading endonuclease RelE of RelBE toxin-antitoxin system